VDSETARNRTLLFPAGSVPERVLGEELHGQLAVSSSTAADVTLFGAAMTVRRCSSTCSILVSLLSVISVLSFILFFTVRPQLVPDR
jgi:hypothetical protein